MKQLFLLILCAVFALSCKKEKNAEDENFSGTWEIEKTMSMVGVTTYPPDNGQIIYLGKDGTFERRSRDTVTFRGRFYITRKRDCYDSNDRSFFKTSDSNSDFIISRERETLVLSTSQCYTDGAVSWYRRIR